MLEFLKKYGVYFIVTLLTVNILFLDYLELIRPKSYVQHIDLPSTASNTSSTNSAQTVQSNTQTILPQNTCPVSCMDAIKIATSSLKLTAPTNAPAQTITSGGAKEFFIPFGASSGYSSDWSDIGGLQAYIDTTQYSGIKSAVFEVAVRIPTGNEIAWVRLINKTDGTPLLGSEVSLSGGTPQLLTSNPFTLGFGKKLYQVQIKTQLQFPAYIDSARVHITTN